MKRAPHWCNSLSWVTVDGGQNGGLNVSHIGEYVRDVRQAARRKYLSSAMLNPSANHSSEADELAQRTFISKSAGDNCIIIARTSAMSHGLCLYYRADSTTTDCEFGLYAYFITDKKHFWSRMKEGLTDDGHLTQEQHMHLGVNCMRRE